MPYTEAKEHAPGRLHTIFTDPYSAFDNEVVERRLHLRVALQALLDRPSREGRLTLRVLHGWANGEADPQTLTHSDHPLTRRDDLLPVVARYQAAIDAQLAPPREAETLLAGPLAEAIAAAEARGQTIDTETRSNPAHWPSFERGLSLYTFFKVYHRLTYGEDESYRVARCETPEGPREIHEFHLEECEFGVVTGLEGDDRARVILLVHAGALPPLAAFVETMLGD
ncbi:hypothetical protein [Halomonas sp. 328]|uniref:hypothetical protein n=1 Tax=Halomonas sp. 328 TaxID=2776704 RepID=UPI0018A7220C|nr:hypothetical protein [Halomonas sp. 328]MBF8222009.1 hypothetical protein [Halomonas sp. 328]